MTAAGTVTLQQEAPSVSYDSTAQHRIFQCCIPRLPLHCVQAYLLNTGFSSRDSDAGSSGARQDAYSTYLAPVVGTGRGEGGGAVRGRIEVRTVARVQKLLFDLGTAAHCMLQKSFLSSARHSSAEMSGPSATAEPSVPPRD